MKKKANVIIKNKNTQEERMLDVDGIFIAIGMVPESELLKGLVELDENGYVVVNNRMETKIPGIYACGDIIKKDVYQIVTAESEGAIAATFVKKYIDIND